MHKEHSRVILTEPVESDDGGLMSPGDIGVVIHIHPEEWRMCLNSWE